METAIKIDFKLRKANKNDDELLLDLFCSTQGKQFEHLPLPKEQVRSLLEQQFLTRQQDYASNYPDAETSIIEIDNKAVGMLCIDCQANSIHIVNIEIFPACQNQGIGSAVLRKILQDATISNSKAVLNIMHTNPAFRLYKRLGFETIRETDLYYTMEWPRKY